jgi:uncharacterized protein (TIGR03032 family)
MSTAADAPWLEVTASRDFVPWLARHNVSLAFSTYQAGKLFFLGRNAAGTLSVFERTFNRCMGLFGDGQTLWMSSLFQLWRFENVLRPGELHEGYDRLFVPRVGYTTGDLDIHDVVCDANGRIVFVNTRLNCLATMDATHSFSPLWKPPHISRLAAEDRCHLNGLALRDGRPAYVTLVGMTDIADGWRDRRRDGGCVLEVPSGRVVASGLSMPHSPRFHNGRLWVLNSGTGEFGSIDLETGAFRPLAFLPGYMRGLCFVGNYAIIGLSRPRHEKTFSGLALDDRLKAEGVEPRCGLAVIDLKTGDQVNWVQIEGLVSELYDVVALPGATRPMALGFANDDVSRLLTIGTPGEL